MKPSPLTPGPHLGFFVCGGELRVRRQTPQTFTGISRIQTGFLVKHYVRKKIGFPGGGNFPPCPPPPAMYDPEHTKFTIFQINFLLPDATKAMQRFDFVKFSVRIENFEILKQ